MANSYPSKKLLIKPNQQIAVINAPPGYEAQLGPLPEGVKVSESLAGGFDLVHLFCKNSKEFEELAYRDPAEKSKFSENSPRRRYDFGAKITSKRGFRLDF